MFPPVLPQYRLDEQQWYPPLFPLLLARLPPRVFDSYSHLIAIVIDLVRMLLLLWVAHWQSDGSLAVIAIAGLIYATIPIQTSYNIQLNPRGLGALMLEIVLMLLLWFYVSGDGWWVWVPIVAALGADPSDPQDDDPAVLVHHPRHRRWSIASGRCWR